MTLTERWNQMEENKSNHFVLSILYLACGVSNPPQKIEQNNNNYSVFWPNEIINIYFIEARVYSRHWLTSRRKQQHQSARSKCNWFFFLIFIVSEIFQNITRFWWHFQLKPTHFGKRCLWTSVGSSAKFNVFLWQSWNSVENSCKKNKRKKTNRTEICFTKGAIDSNVWQLYKVPFYLEYLTFIFIYIN